MTASDGTSAMFDAAQDHATDTRTSLTAIALALHELVLAAYLIHHDLQDIRSQLEFGDHE